MEDTERTERRLKTRKRVDREGKMLREDMVPDDGYAEPASKAWSTTMCGFAPTKQSSELWGDSRTEGNEWHTRWSAGSVSTPDGIAPTGFLDFRLCASEDDEGATRNFLRYPSLPCRTTSPSYDGFSCCWTIVIVDVSGRLVFSDSLDLLSIGRLPSRLSPRPPLRPFTVS